MAFILWIIERMIKGGWPAQFNVSLEDAKKSSKPASLNIITGTGMSYTRPDGINVISVASLGK